MGGRRVSSARAEGGERESARRTKAVIMALILRSKPQEMTQTQAACPSCMLVRMLMLVTVDAEEEVSSG